MKRILSFLILLTSASFCVFSQSSVSIGSNAAKSNAVLWLNSVGKNQGVIIPIVSNRTGIASPGPEAGMIVFDDSDKKVYFYNGTTWIEAGGAGSVVAVDNLTIESVGGKLQVKDAGITDIKISPTANISGSKINPNFGSQNITTTVGLTAATGTFSGNVNVKGLSYTWPGAQGTGVLSNNGSGTLTWSPLAAGGTVTNVSGTAPVTVTNSTTTPLISMAQANGSTNGFISSADWTTFNGKLNSNTLTTSGDLLFHNGTIVTRLPRGTNGQVLSSTGTGIQWSPSTGLTNPMTAQGDIIFGGAAGSPSRLAGATGFLKSTGAFAPTWSAVNMASTDVTGVLPLANGGTGGTDALSARSSLGLGSLSILSAVTTTEITNGTIANIDVNAGAAIAGTKISPNFGSQNITTTGSTVLNTVSYSWPNAQGAANTFLKNDGAGAVSWAGIPSAFSTLNVIPKGDGTGLVASSIFDDGTYTGLGRSTPVGSSRFDIEATGFGANTYGGMYINTDNTGWPFYGYANTGGTSMWTYWNGQTGTWNLYNNGDRLSVTNTGNVGIGTSAPLYTLEANGNIINSNPSSGYIGLTGDLPGYSAGIYPTLKTSNDYLYFSAGGKYTAYMGGTTDGIIGLNDSNSTPTVVLNSNGNSYISNGNVGIGTTAPAQKLDVDGSIRTNGYLYFYDGKYIFHVSGLYSGLNDHWIPNNSNLFDLGTSTYRWRTLYLVNNPSVSSDLRLKKDVHNLNYGLSEILKLRPVSYKLKEDTEEKTKLGFIAQEVKELIPEIVMDDSSKEKMLSMSYSELIPVLIKAIQEQQKTIEELRNNLSVEKSDRSAKLESLSKRVDELMGYITTTSKEDK